MTVEPIELLQALFSDIGFRARPAVIWSANSRSLPITVTLNAGEDGVAALVLDGSDVAEAVCGFTAELQSLLKPFIRGGLPPCPTHGLSLVAKQNLDMLEWRCTEGDFSCALGEYEESLWPPGSDERDAAPMLAGRLPSVSTLGEPGAGLKVCIERASKENEDDRDQGPRAGGWIPAE